MLCAQLRLSIFMATWCNNRLLLSGFICIKSQVKSNMHARQVLVVTTCFWCSQFVLPARQLAPNVSLPPSRIEQRVPWLLDNIGEHCQVCNFSYEPKSSNQHTQWCCKALSTSLHILWVLLMLLAILSPSCCNNSTFIAQETGFAWDLEFTLSQNLQTTL